MARQLRLEYAGAIYHVMSRGDRQEAIFYRTLVVWVHIKSKLSFGFFEKWHRRLSDPEAHRLCALVWTLVSMGSVR